MDSDSGRMSSLNWRQNMGNDFFDAAEFSFARQWGHEWHNLTTHEQRAVIMDWMTPAYDAETGEEEYDTVKTLAKRIGKGNLKAYAQTQVARFVKTGEL